MSLLLILHGWMLSKQASYIIRARQNVTTAMEEIKSDVRVPIKIKKEEALAG